MRNWTGRVFIGVSLDGFIARPNGDIDWLEDASTAGDHAPGDPDLPEDHGYAAHMASVDHVVMGRATYEKMLTLGGWPFSEHQVVVISTMLETDDDRITIVPSVDAAVRLLDERGSRGVYVDGGRTIQAFLREGLIDELVITRLPILIGEGLPLFGPLPQDVHLIHQGTVATGGSGFVQSRYRVRRDPVNRS